MMFFFFFQAAQAEAAARGNGSRYPEHETRDYLSATRRTNRTHTQRDYISIGGR